MTGQCKCARCGIALDIERVFTIRHGAVRKYNLAFLCEPCVDTLLTAEAAAEAGQRTMVTGQDGLDRMVD